ncbi:MAG: hypothetical protein AB1679_00865 [Actinomycetota bacterium]
MTDLVDPTPLALHRPTLRFQEFVCRECHRHGRHHDALMLAWTAFEDRPALPTYQHLVDHATQTGVWPEWRPRAIAVLRRHVEEAREAATSRNGTNRHVFPFHPPGAAVLIEVLLWEGDIDGAWEEALSGDCSHRLWMRLADARQATHPGDAIPVYQREVEQLINLRHYGAAVEVMDHIRHLRVRAGQPEEFRGDVAPVRATHTAKRKLMQLLDANGW